MKINKSLFLLAFTWYLPAHAADLTVNIENTTKTKAPIICDLFEAADAFPVKRKLAAASVNAELSDANAICVFKDIQAKKIAISIIEDLNNNGKLDTTMVGFPREPWAVSNNVRANRLGPPTFEEAAIDGAITSNIMIKLIKP